MSKVKFYTVYKITFNSIHTDLKTEKINFMISAMTDSDHCAWRSEQRKSFNVDFNSDKDAVQRCCKEERWNDSYNRRNERVAYTCYKHSLFVARCDRKLGFIPTVGNIKSILEYANAQKENGHVYVNVQEFLDKYEGLDAKGILAKYMEEVRLYDEEK